MSGMELWWLGQSGFRLRDPSGGPVLFVDPFLSPHEGRTWDAPITPEELGRQADAILCTHEHIDHFDQPALKSAAAVPDSHFTLIIPRPIVDQALALGIPHERVVGAEPDQPVEVAGVQVHPVPACHGVGVGDAYTFGEQVSDGRVRFLGYVVELGGVRVYHAGDCVPYEGQTDRVRTLRPHLALLPINGRDFYRETERNLVGTMDIREAAHLAADLGVGALVPMHWELFLHNRGFPGDLASYVAQFFPQLTLLILGQAARFTYVVPAKPGE
jgi:L-ascorbate 6-phosphate lactonase